MVTVVVAEGDAGVRSARGAALAGAGYAVVEAATGLAALTAMAALESPYVAVVDAQLPDLDATAIVRFARRALRAERHPPAMLLTADAHAAPLLFIEEALDPLVWVLASSISLDGLIAAVRSAEWLMLAGLAEPAGQAQRLEVVSHA